MTNPWTAYLNDYLLAEGLIKASIHALDGRALAASTHFRITSEQASRAWAYLKLKPEVPLTSLTIAGHDYRINSYYSQFIYGFRENAGCVLANARDVLIVGLHDEKMHAIQAVRIVTHLVERLDEQGPGR